MNYSAIDLHSNNSVVSVTDEEDRVVVEKRLQCLRCFPQLPHAHFQLRQFRRGNCLNTQPVAGLVQSHQLPDFRERKSGSLRVFYEAQPLTRL